MHRELSTRDAEIKRMRGEIDQIKAENQIHIKNQQHTVENLVKAEMQRQLANRKKEQQNYINTQVTQSTENALKEAYNDYTQLRQEVSDIGRDVQRHDVKNR